MSSELGNSAFRARRERPTSGCATKAGGSRLAGIAKTLDVPVSYFFDQSAEAMEAAQGSLLNTRGAVSLLRAYAAVKDQRQRQAMVNIARAMAGEEPLGDEDAAH